MEDLTDTAAGTTPADTTPAPAPAAEPTVRKAPGKMTTVLGHFGDNQFKTLVNLGESATDKQIADAILKLGPGDYDVLVFRTYKKVYKKIEKNVIS